MSVILLLVVSDSYCSYHLCSTSSFFSWRNFTVLKESTSRCEKFTLKILIPRSIAIESIKFTLEDGIHCGTFSRMIKLPFLLIFQGQKMVLVACGWRHTITVSSSGSIYTYGWSKYGQLGHGDFEDHLVPHKLEALKDTTISQV